MESPERRMDKATLEKVGADGTARVDVVCPGFVADCLETLEEIAMECKAAFLSSGGKEFHYIPCMNERPAWIAALRDLVATHLAGWPLAAQADPDAAARASRAHCSLPSPMRNSSSRVS